MNFKRGCNLSYSVIVALVTLNIPMLLPLVIRMVLSYYVRTRSHLLLKSSLK
jgi:hypothetical protein